MVTPSARDFGGNTGLKKRHVAIDTSIIVYKTKGYKMLPKNVTDYIEKRTDLLVSWTARFIQTCGLSGSEGSVAEVLSNQLKSSGLDPAIDKAGNLIATLDKTDSSRGKPRTLAFNVHLDTVPAGSPESWTRDPFSGALEGNKIYGRGASDTKGAWAPIILAIEAVNNCGTPLNGNILFTAVVMEELGLCSGMKVLLEDTLRDHVPDFIILGEPTSLDIAVGHKGKTEIKVATKGRACHASAPEQGKNALYEAARVTAVIEKMALAAASESEDPLFGRATMAMTDITCNPGVRNIIPDVCTMYVDCRFLPGETPETIRKQVERELVRNGVNASVHISSDYTRTYTGMDVGGLKFIPAFSLKEDHPLVTMAFNAASATIGRNPRIFRWNFATDGGWSMGNLGIPTIGFSPCEEILAHTTDEFVRIDYMEKAAKAYAAMIIEILGDNDQCSLRPGKNSKIS